MGLRWLWALLLALPGAWGDCQQPPRFVFAEPPMPLEESYAVGTSLTYRCRPGYRMASGKSPRVTCLPTSLWSAESSDFCIGKSCGPPDIMNGRFHTETNLLFGARITYSCNIGYRLVGQPSAQCVLKDNEIFWSNIPICASIHCSAPPVIENGQFSNGDRDFTFGMAVTYRCNKDFVLIGHPVIYCTVMNDNVTGTWSSAAPECKVVQCENPEVKNGRRLSGFGTEHTYKDTVMFECNPGHLLNGSSVVICEADNTWKPSLPTCDPIHCGPAPQFPFAEGERAVGDSSLAGTTLKYRCKPGYTTASGKSSVVTCLSNRTWSADPDFCIQQECAPPTIENGDVIAANFLFGTVVTFTCHTGYELKVSSAKCVVSGNGVDWDTAPPYCERQLPSVQCVEPPAIDNGMHNGTKGTSFVQGSAVVYQCKDGFTLAGAATLHCEADNLLRGVWSNPAPECRGGANMIIVGIFPVLLAMLVTNV
ncbi:complement receptor type 1-like [Phalacrocorax carbo]|uniref:complement receptor type 1-like n=1 Tax=Phalacrocorax carbo TaxID=9209 RepID=UPI0031195F76